MRQQHEITTSAPLLGKDGDLLEPGWARSLLPVYRRADIKASPMRIKEWDYYCINNGFLPCTCTTVNRGAQKLESHRQLRRKVRLGAVKLIAAYSLGKSLAIGFVKIIDDGL